jgi:signal transduction histidine kinase
VGQRLAPVLLQRGSARADLLIVDLVGLPQEDLDLLPDLVGRGPPLRVAVLKEGDIQSLRSALRAEVHGLLLDPFDLTQVQSTLTRLLDTGRAGPRETASLDALAIFLKGISHEVLNPLTSISGLLQLLRLEQSQLQPAPETGSPEQERGKRYQTMLENVERIQGILHELEHFVRSRKPSRQVLDPRQLLQDVAKALQEGHPPTHFQVVADGEGAVLGDAEQLKVALLHLVRYAAGTTSTSPVSARIASNETDVEIDLLGSTALPLPVEPSELFYPYHETPGGPTGSLQLSAAFGILRGHQGSVQAETGPHGELRFLVRLPRASERLAPPK